MLNTNTERRLLVCVLIILIGGCANSNARIQTSKSMPIPEQTIDEMFRDFDGFSNPGATVALYHDGEIALIKTYGCADPLNNTLAAPETNYRLASVTKQFTAMCIMMLNERGKLSYDDPITRFFPEFPPIGNEITLRHLLGHTSGLKDYEDVMPADQKEQLKDRDVLRLVAQENETYFPPGTQYRYSNSGYAFLALIVEKVSGKSFATFLHDNIFEPLGMDNTVAYEKGISTVPNRAMGYRKSANDEWVDADQSLTSAVLGDGGIYTSVLDYFKWDQALYTDKLVSRETLAEAFTSGKLADGTLTGYGYGWRIDERHGTTVIHHNGGTCGFNNAVRRIPSQQQTLVILTNRAGEQAHEIANKLVDQILTKNQ